MMIALSKTLGRVPDWRGIRNGTGLGKGEAACERKAEAGMGDSQNSLEGLRCKGAKATACRE